VAAVALYGGLFVVSPVILILLFLTECLFSSGRLPTRDLVITYGPVAFVLGAPFSMVLGLCAGGLTAMAWQAGIWAAMRWPARTTRPPAAPIPPTPQARATPCLPPRRWPLAAAAFVVAAGYMAAGPYVLSWSLPWTPSDPEAAARIADVLGLLLGCIVSLAAWRSARRRWADDPAARPPVARAVLWSGLLLVGSLLALPGLLAGCGWLLGSFHDPARTYRLLAEIAMVLLRFALLFGLIGGLLAGLVWGLAVRIAMRRSRRTV
jgi:hypothetical protein